jgi:hypothetical protein
MKTSLPQDLQYIENGNVLLVAAKALYLEHGIELNGGLDERGVYVLQLKIDGPTTKGTL